MAPPVPAGISRPTITFSFRPSSMSTLPLTAASVRTRVVSWKEAAENTERVCKRRLGDAQQDGAAFGGLVAVVRRLLVGGFQFRRVDMLAGDQRGFAAVGDFQLLHHLAADHFDMLVVDLHALQTIDVLDFLDEIDRQFFHALDAQDVMRRGIAFDDIVALLHIIAFAHADMAALGDQILARLQLVDLGFTMTRRLFL